MGTQDEHSEEGTPTGETDRVGTHDCTKDCDTME